jgi:hypothetical protein
MRKPATLLLKTEEKMIQPYQKATTIEPETTSCQNHQRRPEGDAGAEPDAT